MASTKEILDKSIKLVKTKPCDVIQQFDRPYPFTVSVDGKECLTIHSEYLCGDNGNRYKIIIKYPDEEKIEIAYGTVYYEASHLLSCIENIAEKQKEAKKSNQTPKQEIVDERRAKQMRILNYLDSLLVNQG